MGNCLVTKLKEEVNNSNLPYLDGLVLTVLPNPGDYDLNKDYSIKFYGITHIKIIGNGSVYLVNEGVTVTDEHDIVSPLVYLTCAPGNYKVLFTSKYDIYETGYYNAATLPYGRGIKFDISDLNYSNISVLWFNSCTATGEYTNKITNGSRLSKLYLAVNDYSQKYDYKININSLKYCNNLEEIFTRNCYSYGDITNLINCTNLKTLNIPVTNISGDLKVFLDGQVSKGRTNGSLIISFLNANLTYNGMPLRNQQEAQAAIGLYTYSVIANFDSSAPDGYTLTANL